MTKISIVQNSLRHLHIFKGIPTLSFRNSRNITKDTIKAKEESEVYVQEVTDIIYIKEHLSQRQIKDLENGYRVVIDDIGFF